MLTFVSGIGRVLIESPNIFPVFLSELAVDDTFQTNFLSYFLQVKDIEPDDSVTNSR